MTDFDSLKGVKKLAILGGTFDPIHLGHISVAEEILKKTEVEKVLFIPSGKPPHKGGDGICQPIDRLKMTKLAIKNKRDMCVSSVEIDRGGMTYTVDTIGELRQSLGDNIDFKFVMGADAMHYITTWKNYKKLFEICSFIAVTRPGYNKNSLLKEIDFMEETLNVDIEFVEIAPVDISSSMIRENISKGISIEGLVPKKVEQYIVENNLYKVL